MSNDSIIYHLLYKRFASSKSAISVNTSWDTCTCYMYS